jgi:hypothetical protein
MGQRSDEPLSDAAVKRGRGRPRLAQALTPAQRAKRYRDKRKREAGTGAVPREGAAGAAEASNKPDTRPSIGLLEARIVLLNADNLRLSQDLDAARDRLEALSRALAECLRAHAARKVLADELARAFLPLLSPQDAKQLGMKSVTRHKK